MSNNQQQTDPYAHLSVERDEITGQITVMTHEDRRSYNKILEAMMEDLTPAGILETRLVEAIAHDSWCYNCFRDMENFVQNAHLFTMLDRRQDMIDHNSKRLLKIQAARRAERDLALDKAAALAQLNFSKGQTYNPDFDFPPGDGFDFSIHEIEARVHRNERLKQARALERQRRRSESDHLKAA